MPAGSEHDVAPPPSRRPVQRISGPNRTTPPDARAVPVVPREHHAPIDDHQGASTPAAASAVPRTYAPQSHSSRPHAGSSMPRTTPAPPTGPRVSQRPTSPHSRPSNPSSLSERQGRSAGSARTTRRRPVARIIAVLVLVALVAWPVGLVMWANGKLNRVEALSGAPNTPGDTYLIAGSDSREGTDIGGDAPGARTDTIMLLHAPEDGPTALISLPRDIYVAIPGHDSSKINAAYSWGGAPLLVDTVEELTGLTVDHYVEVGFSGVQGIVDAVGGVELCYDRDVQDKESRLDWTAGCHMADGDQALAFARMRKADPLGDIGRAERQRQVVSAVATSLQDPAKLINPATQTKLINAGTGAVVVDEQSGVTDLGKLALAFRNANSDSGITGTPPIESLDYRPGGVGSAVKLDDEGTVRFFADIATGSLAPGEYNGLD